MFVNAIYFLFFFATYLRQTPCQMFLSFPLSGSYTRLNVRIHIHLHTVWYIHALRKTIFPINSRISVNVSVLLLQVTTVG